jgi:hypothetical protein
MPSTATRGALLRTVGLAGHNPAAAAGIVVARVGLQELGGGQATSNGMGLRSLAILCVDGVRAGLVLVGRRRCA